MKGHLIFILSLIQISLNAQNFDIYVSDAGNFSNPPWQILKFDSAGQNPSVFISTNLNWPQDILFLEDSNIVLVSNLGTGNISRYDANNGTYLSDFATSIGGPTRMKIGPDSMLNVLQWSGDGLVRRYSLDGTFLGNFTSVGVNQSIGFDWDANQNLYVSSYGGKHIRKFDMQGNDLGMFIDSNLVGPTNIWFDSNGDLVVLDYNGNSVKKFDSTGNYIGTVISGIGQPEGVSFLQNGNVLIGSGFSHSVKMYDQNFSFIHDFIPANSGNLITPNAIVLRNKTNVSVDENILTKTKLIYPSSGVIFQFSEQAKLAEEISLSGLDGKFIQIIPIGDTWNAESLSEGYYIVSFSFKGRKQVTEQILIKS